MTHSDALSTLRKLWQHDPRLRELIEVIAARFKQQTVQDAREYIDLKNATLEQLEKLAKRHGKALTCPVCGRHRGVYKRRIYKTPAVSLLALVELWEESGRQGWIDRTRLVKRIFEKEPKIGKDLMMRDGDFSKLRWYGLIEQMGAEKGGKCKRGSSFWRPTQKGVDFVRGRVSVPSHTFSSGSLCHGFTDTLVTFSEVYKVRFEHAEVGVEK